MSSAKDFLRASQASFLGTFNGATTEGSNTVYGAMPYVLNPVPGVGSTDSSLVIGTQFLALYIPKGRCLWAAVKKKTSSVTATEAPLLGVLGGFYCCLENEVISIPAYMPLKALRVLIGLLEIQSIWFYPSNREFGSSVHRSVIDKWNLESDWVKWRKVMRYITALWSTLKIRNVNYDQV